jgi:hypothetical protein
MGLLDSEIEPRLSFPSPHHNHGDRWQNTIPDQSSRNAKRYRNLSLSNGENILWEGKKARIAHGTMTTPVRDGGKQVLDTPARNEAIDLWNLLSYLNLGPERASWCYFIDHILSKYLQMSYLNVRPGQILNDFLQDIAIPISQKTPLPEDIKRMITAARKYKLQFTGLSISHDLKLKMPIWKHPAVKKLQYQNACRRNAAKCLRLNHGVRTIQETLIIANRETVITRKPHQVNPSGIGRKNCGCTLCYRDHAQLGCEHPGECIETAKILLDSIMPKWNPTVPSPDLCDELELTAMEREENTCPRESDRIITFNPDFTLSNIRDSKSTPHVR